MKYAIHPSIITSKTDGNEHFITAYQLMNLYKVNPKECFIWDKESSLSRRWNDYIHLFPRFDGNYDLPTGEGEGMKLTMMYFKDIVEKNGKTIEENNLARKRKFKVGDKVIFTIETEITRIGRDCDGTALYEADYIGSGWREENFKLF